MPLGSPWRGLFRVLEDYLMAEYSKDSRMVQMEYKRGLWDLEGVRWRRW